MSETISDAEAETKLDNGIWDNELLIQAYEGTKMLTKEMLAKHIARATNSHPGTLEYNEMSSNEDHIDNTIQFKVGDYVRATYTDGIDYEARILAINNDAKTCVIKYIGYENEQEILISGLISSWGKSERQKQYLKAKQDSQNTQKENDLPFIIPPPPPLPSNFSQFQNSEDAEHISAMLIAWYMSGFYTGYYQGLQTVKHKKSKK